MLRKYKRNVSIMSSQQRDAKRKRVQSPADTTRAVRPAEQQPLAPQVAMSTFDKVLEQLMSLVYKWIGLFYVGLLLPRKSFQRVDCLSIADRSAPLPYLTDLIVDYVLTQLLPFSTIFDTQALVGAANDPASEQNVKEGLNQAIIAIKKHFSCIEVMQTTETNTHIKEFFQGNHFITPQAVHHIVQFGIQFKSYLRILLGENEQPDAYFNAVKNLAQRNILNTANLQALGDPAYPQIVRAILWILTAYADWFNVKLIDIADVLATSSMILPNISKAASVYLKSLETEQLHEYRTKAIKEQQRRDGLALRYIDNPTGKDNLLSVEYSIDERYNLAQSTKGLSVLSPASKEQQIQNELYALLKDNDLCITDPALRRLVYLVVNILAAPSLTNPPLQLAKQVCSFCGLFANLTNQIM